MTDQEVFTEILGFPPARYPPETFFKLVNGGFIFVPKLMADAILEEMRFIAFSENSDIWVYRDKLGIWKNNGFDVIKAIIANWLGESFKPLYATSTEKYIRYTNYVDPKVLGGNPSKIALKNGVYDLETGVFDGHSPDFYMIQALPFDYNPNATAPKINKFLNEVCPDRVTTLKEMAAYCLVRKMPLHRFFILTGTGRNGKGTYINLVKAFLGPENVASVSLQQIDVNRFKAAELHGKLANLNNDIPSKALKNTGILKQLTSGDMITVEKKRQDPFQFENYAKLIFSANDVPRSRDNSDAFYRRSVALKFEQEFDDGENADPNMINKITVEEELSGFFNECIEHLKTLFERGKFYGEKTIHDKKMEYVKLSDPIHFFAITQVRKNIDSLVTKSDLYNAYVDLCESLDKIPTADNWFGKNVRRYLPYTHEAIVELGGKRTRVWKGITLVEFVDFPDQANTQYRANQHNRFNTLEYNWKRENARNCVSAVSEEHPPSLQDKLEEFLTSLASIEKENNGEPVEFILFVKELVGKGWKASEVKRIRDVLQKQDQVIYEPRPGFIKRCPP